MNASSTYSVLFGGKPVVLEGTHLAAGDRAPHFTVVDRKLQPIEIDQFDQRVTVFSVFPSVDTPVCALQNIRFNKEAQTLERSVRIISLSVDLPFAQSRFCAAEHTDQVEIYSDYRTLDFGLKYGFVLGGVRLLARGVVVVDRKGIIRHIEYVPDVSHEPDYEAALHAIRSIG